ncbi:MAG: anaerobic ribonucleoside-triphosphate reductase activating protein [Candidatus Alcyoniella australis]|nr:anaerobic ribonucleoside-triphosphate reductase activating protein [Candidatus Alcyoniella australis]
MNIKGFQGLSLIEYPGQLSAILFTGGCDFRCPWCHNPDLINPNGDIPNLPLEHAFEMLERRKGFIDAVCITGGEPMIHRELPEFIAKLRAMDLKIKVDTNGHHPKILAEILDNGLADYVAMDFKAPLEIYNKAAGKLVDLSKIEQSIDLLMQWDGHYEFRTSVIPGLIGAPQIESIARRIEGAKLYALQQFRPQVTLDPSLHDLEPYPNAELERFAGIARSYITEVILRGV